MEDQLSAKEQRVSVRIPVELLEQLKRLAAEERRSQNQEFVYALTHYTRTYVRRKAREAIE